MSCKCPACGAGLTITAEKKEPVQAAINSTNDPYATLPWKQSLKKQNLGTLLVTPKLLENPLARELYDRCKEWKTMKVGKVSYRYSQMENGTEFLQQWRPFTIA